MTKSAAVGSVVGVAALRLVVTHGDLIRTLSEGWVLPNGEGVLATARLGRIPTTFVVALVNVNLFAGFNVATVTDTVVGESSVTVRVA